MHLLHPISFLKLSFGSSWVQKTKKSIYEISKMPFYDMNFNFAHIYMSLLNCVLGVLCVFACFGCSRALRAFVLTCLRAYVLSVLVCLPAWRACVLTCLACLRACLLTCLRAWHAYVLACLCTWCVCMRVCVVVTMKCFIFLRVCTLGVWCTFLSYLLYISKLKFKNS